MKLLRLEINGYKNLREKTIFDFSDVTNYVALIGLNGSGKSNVLEAISYILYSVYYKKQIEDINYLFEYEINGNNVKLCDNQILVNGKSRKRSFNQFLPTEIISCYSGEELRMWEQIYALPYLRYFNKIKSNVLKYPLHFVYVNKYCWEISLLTLLCHTDGQNYIKDLLKIDNLEDVQINFTFANNYEQRKRRFENSTGVNELTNFIERVKENPNPLAITQISTIDLNETDNTKFCRKIFYFLFIASMPKDKKLITNIDIKFNDSNIKNLSEGEKKLILVKCITTILAKENSLLLLDEPDSSLHIHRKQELKEIIDVENRTTILTTHSPKLIKEFDDKNIFILNDTDLGVDIIPAKDIDAIQHISNGEFSILDVTVAIHNKQDILLVEGTNDYNYITKSIEMLSPDYKDFNFHIINCGGADNVPAVLEQSLLSILNESQLCLCTFDYDIQGRRNFDKIIEISTNENKNNLKAMFHTKLDNTPHINNEDFYMENYFPLETYKNDILNSINSKTTFKQLEEYQKPKSIIQKKYESFDSSKYENFRVLLDEILQIKREFHNSL